MDITKLTHAQLSHAAFCGQITYAQWDAEEARRAELKHPISAAQHYSPQQPPPRWASETFTVWSAGGPVEFYSPRSSAELLADILSVAQ